MITFEAPKNQSSIIKVIGVGGGGSNAVNHMYRHGITDVDFIVCNTDLQALEMSPVPNRVHLGKKGLGAGSLPYVGEKAALEKADEIKEYLSHNTEMLFITAGMGGGTGTGAAPVIAKIAKEIDLNDEDVPKILTIAIVTIPFSFEGKKRRDQALKGITELRKYCDAVLMISNDKLRDLFGNLPLSKAFAQADNVLLTAAKGIAEIITVKAYVNIDFKDVNTVMSNSGVAILGTGRANGENRAQKAINMALTSPLLNDNDIKGTNNILLYLSSGKQEINMDEITEITEFIIQKAGKEVEIIWGAGKDDSLEDDICITVVATGFEKNEPKPPKKHYLFDENESKSEISVPKIENKKESIELIRTEKIIDEDLTLKTDDTPKKKVYFSLDDEPENKKIERPSVIEPSERRPFLFEMEKPFVKPVIKNKDPETDQMEVKAKERISKLKALSMKIKNPNGLTELENEPAYKRKNVQLNESKPSEESIISRFSLEEDEDNNAELKSDNSFLHDNVD
ncbi:cell division protein FtsZ [Bacteroidota bacterium]